MQGKCLQLFRLQTYDFTKIAGIPGALGLRAFFLVFLGQLWA